MERVYTSSGYQYIPCIYQCSRCGAWNVPLFRIDATGQYTETWTPRSSQEHIAQGHKKAASQLSKNIYAKALVMVDRADRKKYGRLKLNGHCYVCGHTEPWAIGSSQKKYRDVRAEIAALPENSLPLMATNIDELIERVRKRGAPTLDELSALFGGTLDHKIQNGNPYLLESLDHDLKSRRVKIIFWRSLACIMLALILINLSSLGVISARNAAWATNMEAASLLSRDENAGDRAVVYEQTRAPENQQYTYVKRYLDDGMTASTPDEVGYVVRITYNYLQLGTYGDDAKVKGYRVDTFIQVFDRHTGEFIEDAVMFKGSDPPSSISTSEPYGQSLVLPGKVMRDAVNGLLSVARGEIEDYDPPSEIDYSLSDQPR